MQQAKACAEFLHAALVKGACVAFVSATGIRIKPTLAEKPKPRAGFSARMIGTRGMVRDKKSGKGSPPACNVWESLVTRTGMVYLCIR
jgi:hypothetical protein